MVRIVNREVDRLERRVHVHQVALRRYALALMPPDSTVWYYPVAGHEERFAAVVDSPIFQIGDEDVVDLRDLDEAYRQKHDRTRVKAAALWALEPRVVQVMHDPASPDRQLPPPGVCPECNWTNTGLLNYGSAEGGSLWLCHGCAARRLSAAHRMEKAELDAYAGVFSDVAKVERRADGAYTAGPPPDGRSVEAHLDELTARPAHPAAATDAQLHNADTGRSTSTPSIDDDETGEARRVEMHRRQQLTIATQERDAYRAMLCDVLASARPHPKEHPTMTKAWARATELLKNGPQRPPDGRPIDEHLIELSTRKIQANSSDSMDAVHEAHRILISKRARVLLDELHAILQFDANGKIAGITVEPTADTLQRLEYLLMDLLVPRDIEEGSRG